MACNAATLSAALSQNFCGTDSRMNMLALAGLLYQLTGQTAAQAMENAKCFSGLEDAALQLIIATLPCYGDGT